MSSIGKNGSRQQERCRDCQPLELHDYRPVRVAWLQHGAATVASSTCISARYAAWLSMSGMLEAL